jgi:hypothetical protein
MSWRLKWSEAMSLGVPVQMLLCHNADCNMSFPVYHGLVGTVRPFDQLPDPFEAKCPGCGETTEYSKSEVREIK